MASVKFIKNSLSRNKVFLFLIAFRICNALLLRTFFQPDEYFQSLEPAWHIAFGSESGAWITWEWRQRLRSSLHPYLFALVYRFADGWAYYNAYSSTARSDLLVAAPKVVQAIFAAYSDYYTWVLAKRAYGPVSQASYAALLLTICSPWQWFCSTRTLSNSVETMLTIQALCVWPFPSPSKNGLQKGQYNMMRKAFRSAALATILRPTNVVIWLVVALYTTGRVSSFRVFDAVKALQVEVKAALIAGITVLGISLASDRIYYKEWTFPPLRFIHFNVVQSLAVFYGRNRPDYYVTEGLPLLLTLTLPFAAWGLYCATPGRDARPVSKYTPRIDSDYARPLALSIIVFTAIMSTIAHKEVRFLYPLLPALHVLAAGPFSRFFAPLPWPRSVSKKALLTSMFLLNTGFAFYISRIHQRGVVDVVHFLRNEYEHQYLVPKGDKNSVQGANMTVMFMMPCHSTPWRSHLVYDGIDARALTCEPPVDIPVKQRDTYVDEADEFYANPTEWMMENMEPTENIAATDKGAAVGEKGYKTEFGETSAWPEYLVFFEQLEPVMDVFLKDTRYRSCWKGFNTHWHDDSRRKGDVVVWCLPRHG